MDKEKKAETYECESCGMEVTCDKESGCRVSDLFCCGKPMKKKEEKAPAGQ